MTSLTSRHSVIIKTLQLHNFMKKDQKHHKTLEEVKRMTSFMLNSKLKIPKEMENPEKLERISK